MTAARKFLLPLSIAAILILIAGIWLSHSRNRTEPPASVGDKVLPALAGKLNDVNEIRIVQAGEKPFVTLQRTGGADGKGWTVAERGNFAADFTKVRELLMKLSQLEVVEEKTSNPESYPALGVEDVKGDKATGKRIDLKGIEPPVSLFLGKKGSNYSSNYVRVNGEAKSVLAKPDLMIYAGPEIWLDRASPLDFPEERVQEVRLSNIPPAESHDSGDDKAKAKKPAGKSSYIVTRSSRDQNDFTVPGKKLSSAGAANGIPGGLSNFGFDDVRTLAKDEDWTDAARAEYRLFDGTLVTVLGRKLEMSEAEKKKPRDGFVSDASHHRWVRFEVGFDEAQHKRFEEKKEENKDAKAAAAAQAPADPRSEAQKLNAKVQNWVYDVSGWKYDGIFKPLDDMLEKK